MHQWSLSELQGVPTQRGASSQRTTQDRCSRSSKPRKGGSRNRSLYPPRGAPLWAWLLLGALVVPGAWSFLNEEQEELLVELHNYYRGQVSPSSSAMLPLRWDSSLKVIAEGYAAKCIWNHNPELEDTGENLFAGTGPLDLRVALEKWFLEHLDFDYQNNSCDEDKMCGHYTQMVWADTHRVGCAFHLCNNMEGLDWERVSFLVCNYYPPGNYEDQRPYVEGDWCSRCPVNLQKCENNLCVADTVEEEEDDEVDVDEEEEGTVVPPPATTDAPLQDAAETEEEVAVPPPVTTEALVQPETTTDSPQESEDAPPPTTPALGTKPPPQVPSVKREMEVEATVRVEVKKEEREVEATVRVEVKKEEREVEDTVRVEVKKEEGGKDVARTIYQNITVAMSAGSASSPSLLFACLTAILTLRL